MNDPFYEEDTAYPTVLGEKPSKPLKKVQFSYATLVGFALFFSLIAIVTYLEMTSFNISERKLTMFMGIGVVAALWGVIVDQLRVKQFEFWAVGSLVSAIGVFFAFSPILYYGFFVDNLWIWFFSSLAGLGLLVLGYSVEAYDLNKKIYVALASLWITVRKYEWRMLPGRVLALFGLVITSVVRFVGRGLRSFRYHLGLALGFVRRFIISSAKVFMNIAVATPGFVWKHSYWGFLLAILGLFLWNISSPSLINTIDALLMAFLFVLGISYTYKDYIGETTDRIQDYSWEATQKVQRSIHYVKVRTGLFTCQECGGKLDPVSRECTECRVRAQVCIICQLPIQTGQEVTQCPHCEHIAHTHHWNHWIKIGKNCPICHQQ